MYAPLSVQKVMGQSATISGSLQFPRMILIMILPVIVGTWVSKKAGNTKKAMIIATGVVAASFLVMGFTTSSTPVIVYFVALALTGVAESFRAVSYTHLLWRVWLIKIKFFLQYLEGQVLITTIYLLL